MFIDGYRVAQPILRAVSATVAAKNPLLKRIYAAVLVYRDRRSGGLLQQAVLYAQTKQLNQTDDNQVNGHHVVQKLGHHEDEYAGQNGEYGDEFDMQVHGDFDLGGWRFLSVPLRCLNSD